MTYKEAIKSILSGHPVIYSSALYYLPKGVEPLEKNIRFICIEDVGSTEVDFDEVDKNTIDFELL